jgi:uncharacterized Ntn-hydrolase superfamily protein
MPKHVLLLKPRVRRVLRFMRGLEQAVAPRFHAFVIALCWLVAKAMTYSIIGRDPLTGEIGIAVQSRFFAVGRIVPWIEAGVGAVASQGFSDPVYGYRGLELLSQGATPQDALETIKRADAGAAMRQVAMLDARGRVAVFTGQGCVAAAGHMIGDNCVAQANMMARESVWTAMVSAFQQSGGALADRLLAALTAAQKEGGDIRGTQAAALVVSAPTTTGHAALDRLVDLRVDDHADPVGEIARLLAYGRAHQRASAATDNATAGDLLGALADLDASCSGYPREPEFLCRRAGVLLALGRIDEAREMIARACDIGAGWGEWMLRLADAGIIPVGRRQLQSLIPSALREA